MSDLVQKLQNAVMEGPSESSKAVAETIMQVKLAKEFPRDLAEVEAAIREACKHPSVYERAEYEKPCGGGKVVRGQTIHLMRTLANKMGNIQTVLKTSDEGEYTRLRVAVRDIQENITIAREYDVKHVRYTRATGNRPLRDEEEKFNVIQARAAKCERSCLEALIPQYFQQLALECCRKAKATEQQDSKPQDIQDSVERMITAYASKNVTRQEIVAWADGIPTEKFTWDHVDKLRTIYSSLAEGVPKDRFFKPKKQETATGFLDDDSKIDEIIKGEKNGKTT